jgi:hypothetical protein
MQRFWLVLGFTFLASACQTTNMDLRARTAKNAPAASCARMQDRRSDCEDQVGCFWDYDEGTCASSH